MKSNIFFSNNNKKKNFLFELKKKISRKVFEKKTIEKKMWHDQNRPEDIEEEKEESKPISQPKATKNKNLFTYGIICLAIGLFIYFNFIFLTQKIYDQARFNLLKTMGLEQPESQANFFTTIIEYNKLIHN